ncbi:hypothetical protein HYT24_03355 [Candidatus Pacearchaeota archaeon]|nr:hypothetical protein [Candidatus Pacearchaeota archaeon]
MEIKEKLIIEGRTNWKKRFYVKFEFNKNSIKILRKILNDWGSEALIDNVGQKIGKDSWIPIFDAKPEADIIIGHDSIHMIVFAKPNNKKINIILDKYCDWTQIKYKKGFGPTP